MEEAAAAAESMQEQAARLTDVVGLFKLDARQVTHAAAAAPVTTRRPVAVAVAGKPRKAVAAAAGDWEEF